MTPDHLKKWELILAEVELGDVPIQYIKKVVVRLTGKKQHTINVQNLMKQGLEPPEVEEIVARKLHELDPLIVSYDFILNVERIAEDVQPETDKLLNKL